MFKRTRVNSLAEHQTIWSDLYNFRPAIHLVAGTLKENSGNTAGIIDNSILPRSTGKIINGYRNNKSITDLNYLKGEIILY